MNTGSLCALAQRSGSAQRSRLEIRFPGFQFCVEGIWLRWFQNMIRTPASVFLKRFSGHVCLTKDWKWSMTLTSLLLEEHVDLICCHHHSPLNKPRKMNRFIYGVFMFSSSVFVLLRTEDRLNTIPDMEQNKAVCSIRWKPEQIFPFVCVFELTVIMSPYSGN